MAWFYNATQRKDEIFHPKESLLAEEQILVEKWIPKEVKISIDYLLMVYLQSQVNKLEHYEINT